MSLLLNEYEIIKYIVENLHSKYDIKVKKDVMGLSWLPGTFSFNF